MTIEEAFSILDLHPSASSAQVSARYRALARRNHPDSPLAASRSIDMTTLNEAYGVARRHAKNRALVPIRAKPDRLKLATTGRTGSPKTSSAISRERTRELERRIVEVRTSRALKLRRRARYAGVISASLTSLVILLTKLTDWMPHGFAIAIAAFFAAVVGVSVFANALFTNAADQAEEDVAETVGYLDNPSWLLGVIQSLAPSSAKDGRPSDGWSYWDLRNAVGEWVEIQQMLYEEDRAMEQWRGSRMRQKRYPLWRMIARRFRQLRFDLRRLPRRIMHRMLTPRDAPLFALADRVGHSNFVDLVVAKGLELDLLTEKQVHSSNDVKIVYSLKLEKVDVEGLK
jgi:hypothetical protein